MLLDNLQLSLDTATYDQMVEQKIKDKKILQNPYFRVVIERGGIFEVPDGNYELVKDALIDTVINDEKEINKLLNYLKKYGL